MSGWSISRALSVQACPICLHHLYHLVKILRSNTAKVSHSPHATFPETCGPSRLPCCSGSRLCPTSRCCFLTPLSQTHLCSHPPFSYFFLLLSGSHFFPRRLVHSCALFFSVRDLLQQSLSSQRTAGNHRNQNFFLIYLAGSGLSCSTWYLCLQTMDSHCGTGLSCFSTHGILVP